MNKHITDYQEDIQQKFIESCNNRPHETFYANGIDWMFITEEDNWISVWQKRANTSIYNPSIQSKDKEHAISYCSMHEACNVNLTRLV